MQEKIQARMSGPQDRIASCPFQSVEEIEALGFRDAPYWHHLLTGRHLGIHRPDGRHCNWTARVLTRDKRYLQRCLGPALDLGRGAVSFAAAIQAAFDWFEGPQIAGCASAPRPRGRTEALNFCPMGETYTVGHALKDYMDWTRIARSPGGHYNNLTLINHHLAGGITHVPLETFTARHLQALAVQVIETPPRFGFSRYQPPVPMDGLGPDELRRRKRTFNSLISILRMAFQHAWENGQIASERPWRCLKRISVNHSPRLLFLTRPECQSLLAQCTPALRMLVLAALYTGCRVGELAQLQVEDVGQQVFGLRIAAFKRSPARYVFLPDEGMAFFLAACEGKAPRDRVFMSDKGKVWQRQHTNLFRRAVSRAGLPEAFVFHGLRHTYASDYIRQGLPLEILARQLGHADVRTVSETYGHLAEQFREEQIRTRFSPLDRDQEAAARQRRPALDALWKSLRAVNWRDYAATTTTAAGKPQRQVRTDIGVLAAFGDV